MSVRIIHGDCRDVLPTLASDSVDCVVTSPPYYGLRDYGVDGQIGLEPTMAGYLETMVGVCRELRRVLKPTGTFWLNVGDSYSGSGKGVNPIAGKQSTNRGSQTIGTLYGKVGESARIAAVTNVTRTVDGVLPKNLCMIPNRLAILLQSDGWYVRSEIIWHKPNPMPESVTDRPSVCHEKIWLLTKSERYFYDAEAIRNPMLPSSVARLSQDIDGQAGSERANGGGKTNGPMRAVAKLDKQRGHVRRHDGFNDRWDTMEKSEQQMLGSNARNVWTIATRSFTGSHFATMPPDLAERCIKAGSSERGCCPTCGAPCQRVVERDPKPQGRSPPDVYTGQAYDSPQSAVWWAKKNLGGDARPSKLLGWEPACKCPAHEPIPAIILDPFSGAGTTAMVADRLGRNAIGIELNPAYAEMGKDRIIGDAGLFAEISS